MARKLKTYMKLFGIFNLSHILIAFAAALLVAFGQPAWYWWSGLLAAMFGYALMWGVVLQYENKWHRFFFSGAWFALVQLIQLSWLISHPYIYIYPVYLLFSLMLGVQFGFLGIFITPANLQRFTYIGAIAAFWTLTEWSRLFAFSGFSWNPVGIALASSIYPLQTASIWGIFGLSFWVLLTNLLVLRAWINRWALKPLFLAFTAIVIPYIYGAVQLKINTDAIASNKPSDFNVVLVQTAFPAEATLDFKERKQYIAYALNQWRQILQTTKKQVGHPVDLIVMPEYVVMGGTYSFLFPYEFAKEIFEETFGSESLKSLPPLDLPLARLMIYEDQKKYYVNNAFFAQALANYFHSGVVVGLEDAEEVGHNLEQYSAAVYFQPKDVKDPLAFEVDRYEKRVLVPMGEYIPFEFCRDLAKMYGIMGSFTPGREAKVFEWDNVPFGVSICYEETFGHIMRENKQRGASVLVNISSDSWYPNSRLPAQHFSHALLRTVEGGLPLIRSSNIGITGAVDSLGRVIKILGDGKEGQEWVFDTLLVKVPIYNYQTLYSWLGDALIVGISGALVLVWGIARRKDGK